MDILEIGSKDLHYGEKVELLLHYLNHNEFQTRIEALTTLGSFLSCDEKARDYFHEKRGSEVIINKLRNEKCRNVVEAAFFALGCSTNNHIENQKSLVNGTIFCLLYEILRHPNIFKFKKMFNCTLLLLSMVVNQNSKGQYLLRKSGCLNQLVSMFQKILQIAEKAEDSFKDSLMSSWELVCQCLFLCVNNPKNEKNQCKVSCVFPKAMSFLSSLDCNGNKSMDYIRSCLKIFTGVISDNKTSQESFITCGGICYLKRLLFVFKCSEDEHPLLEACLMLFDVLVTSSNSHTISSVIIIPNLLEILQKKNLQCKLPILLLLFHLMEDDEENQKTFIKNNGPYIIMQSIMNGENDEDLQLVSRALIQTSLQNRKESSSTNDSPSHSHWQSLFDYDINFQGFQMKNTTHEMELCKNPATRNVTTLAIPTPNNDGIHKNYIASSPHEKKIPLRSFDNVESQRSCNGGTSRDAPTLDKPLPDNYSASSPYKKLVPLRSASNEQFQKSFIRNLLRDIAILENPSTDNNSLLKNCIDSSPYIRRASFRPVNKTDSQKSCNSATLGDIAMLDVHSMDNDRLIKNYIDSSANKKRSPVRPVCKVKSQKSITSERTTSSCKRKLDAHMKNMRLSETPRKLKCNLKLSTAIPSVHSISTEQSSLKRHSWGQQQNVLKNSNPVEAHSLDDNNLVQFQNPSGCSNHTDLNSLIGSINIQVLKTSDGLEIDIITNKNKTSASYTSGKTPNLEISNNFDIASTNNMLCYPEVMTNTCSGSTGRKMTITSSKDKKIHNPENLLPASNGDINDFPLKSKTHVLASDTKDCQRENDYSAFIIELIGPGDDYSMKKPASMEVEDKIKTCDDESVEDELPIKALLHESKTDSELPNCDSKDIDRSTSHVYTDSKILDKDKISDKKELLIPKGQKNIRKTEGIRQIPLTRKEIENLESGIKRFGLNFSAIRKSYSFLSVRTSKDLFLAWRDRIPNESPLKKKMLAVSSDDSASE